MAPPISGSVPEPNSSMTTNVLSVEFFTKNFIFCKCDEYVDKSFSIFCPSPISRKIESNMPVSLLSATGIGRPHCNIYCSKHTVLIHTDLPPAFAPDITIIRSRSLSLISRGTMLPPCFSSNSCNIGCRPECQSIIQRLLRVGQTARIRSEYFAMAYRASNCK